MPTLDRLTLASVLHLARVAAFVLLLAALAGAALSLRMVARRRLQDPPPAPGRYRGP